MSRRLPGESGEREAGRSFGLGEVDRRQTAGGSGMNDSRSIGRRGEQCRRGRQQGADAAVGAGAAAAIVVVRIAVVMAGCACSLCLVRMTMAVNGRSIMLHRGHGAGSRRRKPHRPVRARQHGGRRDSLERERQQHQPHEQGTDEILHAPILAWRRHNTRGKQPG